MPERQPTPDQLRHAELLYRRARSDLTVARKLAADPEVEDGAVAYHVQQAVEKAVKALLLLHGIEFPRIHDLDALVRLAEEGSVEMSTVFASIGWLTPWAGKWRYREAPAADRAGAIEAGTEALAWCLGVLDSS